MNKLLAIFFLIRFVPYLAMSQQQEIDSLQKLLAQYEKQPQHAQDTNYLITLNILAYKYYATKPETTIILAEKSKALCQKIAYTQGQIEATKNIGTAYAVQGDYEKAIQHYQAALQVAETNNYIKSAGRLYNNIASVYSRQGNYPEALAYHFKALGIREKIGDKNGIASSMNNIAIIYAKQNNYVKALDFQSKVLTINREMGNTEDIARSLNNIGFYYENQGKYAVALQYYAQSLVASEKIQNIELLALSQMNIGKCYLQQNKVDSALLYLEKAQVSNKGVSDKENESWILQQLAEAYLVKKQYNKALLYAKNGLETAKIAGLKDKEKDCHATSYKIYEALNQYEKALLHHKRFKEIADSLQNEEINKTTHNLQAQYEFDKKVALLEAEQAKKNVEQAKELQSQQFQRNAVIAGLLTMIVISFLIFRSLRKETKAKQLLQTKNTELHQAKEEIQQQAEEIQQLYQNMQATFEDLQHKSINITASITYARRIQAAMLPFESRIAEGVGEGNFFILYQPRDIVSGDFYFYEKIKNTVILAVADCTGHGVPGAFMSMIGNQILTEIIAKNRLLSPDKILNLLHYEIRRTLQQHTNTESRDGMDISIISLSPLENDTSHTQVEYAGAMSSFYYVLQGELYEIKADKKPIGGQQYPNETERIFTKHQLILPVGTVAYLFTDGYQD
jgi:tetratricopeptide (TPR) repeat protein